MRQGAHVAASGGGGNKLFHGRPIIYAISRGAGAEAWDKGNAGKRREVSDRLVFYLYQFPAFYPTIPFSMER